MASRDGAAAEHFPEGAEQIIAFCESLPFVWSGKHQQKQQHLLAYRLTDKCWAKGADVAEEHVIQLLAVADTPIRMLDLKLLLPRQITSGLTYPEDWHQVD
ncbi:Os06g0217950 [Oryza sativa Japonica Group]|uniref:Os06g0217950 protein n=1 Tax=Oryza sativa subsp. japonica TaxID=39947 RepID=A0A0P0WUK0_ORYSJ|nr:Os06g0217950 [Oryza sativa Japonica Group]